MEILAALLGKFCRVEDARPAKEQRREAFASPALQLTGREIC
jgi:hypothetical protein